jgi:hypothetical protein
LLTTCAAIKRLLVAEGTELPNERNSRKVFTERSMRAGPVQDGKRGWTDGDVHAGYESRSMEECVLLAAASVAAEYRPARFMNEYERHAGD